MTRRRLAVLGSLLAITPTATPFPRRARPAPAGVQAPLALDPDVAYAPVEVALQAVAKGAATGRRGCRSSRWSATSTACRS